MRRSVPRRVPGFYRWVLVLFVSACTPDGLGEPATPASGDSIGDAEVESVPGTVHPVFREDLVHELGLELSESAWASLNADGSTYVEATLDDGADTLTVGLRVKGWTSSQPLTGKPSFKVDIDRFIEGQRYHGLEAFDLHAELPDAGAISEWIAYRLFRDQGLPASRTGWAHLSLAGDDYGFYTIVEKKDDQMVEHWWDDTTGSLYESSSESWPCDLDDPGCDCFEVDEQGSGDSRSDLDTLCQAAGTGSLDEVRALVPWTPFLGFMATEIAIGAHDHYAGYSGNFYLYHQPETGSWSFIPSSMNSQFGTSTSYAPSCGAVAYTLEDYQHGILASRCQADEDCLDELYEALRGVVDHLSTTDLGKDIDAVEELVAPWVAADPRTPWSEDDLHAQVDCIRQWLAERPAALADVLPETCLGEGDDLDITGRATLATNQRCDRDTPEAPVWAVTDIDGASVGLAGPATGLDAGDEVLLVVVQGADDAGAFELGTVETVAADTVTLEDAPTLTVGGRLTLQRVPTFVDVTVGPSGMLTTTAWDGSTGGVLAFRATGTLRIEEGGAVSMEGRGYAGGPTGPTDNSAGYQGETWSGTGIGGGSSADSYNQLNGAWAANEGGGGSNITGGGGEHAGGATPGESWDGSSHAPEAGEAYGDATLEHLGLGSGGGGVAYIYGIGGPGGAGGGVVLIWAGELLAEGASAVSARGEDGDAWTAGSWTYGAGGGAGGSIHIVADTLELPAGGLDASGGAGYAEVERVGGDGGVGRVRVDCDTVNGAECSEAALDGLSEPAVGHVRER